MSNITDLRITVNPLSKEVVLNTATHAIDHIFESLDDWQAFSIDGCLIDVHFLYDEKLQISVYPIREGETIVNESIPYTLNIVLTDKEIEDEIF